MLEGRVPLDQGLYAGSLVLESEGGRLDEAVRLLGGLTEGARPVLEPPAAGTSRERAAASRSRSPRASV